MPRIGGAIGLGRLSGGTGHDEPLYREPVDLARDHPEVGFEAAGSDLYSRFSHRSVSMFPHHRARKSALMASGS